MARSSAARAARASRPEASAALEFRVLGVRVHAVQIPDVVSLMKEWIAGRERAHSVAVTGMHGVSEAHGDPEFKRILNAADLVVPDGMPLVWLARLRGHPLRRRVYGPELMLEFCARTQGGRYRHYFYGGPPGVADLLADTLAARFPGLYVAGTCSPPFRPLTQAETAQVAREINDARPDVVWVGLSTPKQERWMHENRERLTAPVLVGVGAAFDLNTGRVKQAPRWMREHGLEWSFRLAQEPRRLWRRYLVNGPRFVWSVALELAGVRRFE